MARAAVNESQLSPPNVTLGNDQSRMHQRKEAMRQARKQVNIDATSVQTQAAGDAMKHGSMPTSHAARPSDRGYNERLLNSVGVDLLWNPTFSKTLSDSAMARIEETTPTTQTSPKSNHGGVYTWTPRTNTGPDVWPSSSAQSHFFRSPLGSSQPVDPAVIDYLHSLGLSPDKYASKLRCVGLDSGTLLDAMKRMVPDNRKDKLEEDLQRLTGLTVAEAMVLVSGLRTGTA